MKKLAKILTYLLTLCLCMLCIAYAVEASPTACEHFHTEWRADGDSCARYCQDCLEELERGSHRIPCTDTSGTCVHCGTVGAAGERFHQSEGYSHDENECWCICVNCHEEFWRQEHIAFCDGDPRTCVNCGSTDVNCFVDHRTQRFHDENEHWFICTACEQEMNRDHHRISCVSDTCIVCEAVGVQGEITHRSSGYDHDENECWKICQDCHEEFWRQEHIAFCNDPHTCVNCEATDVNCFIEHDRQRLHDENECWDICQICQEELWRKAHVARCNDPHTCVNCKTTDVNCIVEHDRQYDHDENEHWAICSWCNQEMNRDHHSGSCKTGECEVCGATVDPELLHIGEEIGTDEKNHWWICAECGKTFSVTEHTADDKGYCEVCGEPVHTEHTWVDEIVTEATCTKAGSKKIVCKECGEVQDTVEIPALGHKEKTAETPATCTKAGSKVTTCETCGETLKTEEIAALGHKEKTAETPATCTKAGSKVTTCETCGETLKTEEIAALGHKEKITETPATCTKAGSKVTTCETCGETLKTEEIAALGHKEKTTTIKGTCTKPGSNVTTCETCGETLKTEETYALEHAPVERLTEATCTADGEKRIVCNRCGEVLSREAIPALGHERKVTVAVRATCATEGLRRIYCTRCNALLGTEVIPAKEHQMTMTSEDDSQVETCTVCGAKRITRNDGTVEQEPAAEVMTKPAPMMLPEHVATQPMEHVSIADVPENVNVVMQQVKQEALSELTLPVDLKPTKVFNVTLYVSEEMEEMADMLIPETLKIAVEVTEEEAKELEGLKLVLILEDGTMEEIAFEITDGMLVFETEQQGVFAFVSAEALV